MRSYYCGELNESHIDQEITLCGWVHRRRDHGGVIFLDLRDREGLLRLCSTLIPARASLLLKRCAASSFCRCVVKCAGARWDTQ